MLLYLYSTGHPCRWPYDRLTSLSLNKSYNLVNKIIITIFYFRENNTIIITSSYFGENNTIIITLLYFGENNTIIITLFNFREKQHNIYHIIFSMESKRVKDFISSMYWALKPMIITFTEIISHNKELWVIIYPTCYIKCLKHHEIKSSRREHTSASSVACDSNDEKSLDLEQGTKSLQN